ncbi:MAG: hypothetical protein SFX18_02155 [Pirellulales bacterium]|nr:hypothetical protein [Pirellulales bacterium]
MTVIHESGHVVCGWLGGGTLREADLAPWRLPQSRFAPDPQPLFTLWGGPVIGVLAPLIAALVIRQRWMWFIAYFCILANGVYLAIAWMSGHQQLDTARLLRHGASPISIAAFCVVTIAIGYVGFRRECLDLLADGQKDRDAPGNAEPDVGTDTR